MKLINETIPYPDKIDQFFEEEDILKYFLVAFPINQGLVRPTQPR